MSQLRFILGKASQIVFADAGVRWGYPPFPVLACTATVGRSGFRTDAQCAFPYRVGEHQLRGQHLAAVVVVGRDVAVVQFRAALCLRVCAEKFSPDVGAVEVDAQFTHLADIIDVGIMA